MAKKEDNLVPFNELTQKKQREIARQGGIASGKARKEKASLKKTIKWLLEESDIRITQGEIYEKYKEQGIDISKLTPGELATIGLWAGAVIGKHENYKVLMEGIDEMKSAGVTETPDVEFKVINTDDSEKEFWNDETN